MSYSFFHFKNGEARQQITDFLFSIGDELYLPDRQAAKKVTDLCYEKGGFIAIYDGDTLCGASGYFIGEPQCDFVNTDVAFMYVAGILPKYRRSRLFVSGLAFALAEFEKMGLRTFRLQAETSNPYTNRLYARFATLRGQSRSIRGIGVNCYEGNTALALRSVDCRKRPLTQTKKEPIAIIGSDSQNHMMGLMG